jgi:CheY-like chemotaxis protein
MQQRPPDLVIADVMISYALDGWSICRKMGSDPALAGVPLMMVSAIVTSEDDGLFPESHSKDVDAFMSKPLNPGVLRQTVAELLAL